MEEKNETEKMENQQILASNQNYGHNEKILKACKRLHDYSYFMKEVNLGLDRGMALDEAIVSAMDDCIEKNVLADILIKCKSEVFYMLLTEYDEKKHLKAVREEGREEGYASGRADGYAELIRVMYQNGLDIETIAKSTNIPLEKIHEIIRKP